MFFQALLNKRKMRDFKSNKLIANAFGIPVAMEAVAMMQASSTFFFAMRVPVGAIDEPERSILSLRSSPKRS